LIEIAFSAKKRSLTLKCPQFCLLWFGNFQQEKYDMAAAKLQAGLELKPNDPEGLLI